MALGLPATAVNDAAGGGQLLVQLAGILGIGDGLETVPGAAAGLTADAGDGAGVAAHLAPVGDLAGEDVGDLRNGQVRDLAVGVDDDGDAVQGHGGLLETGGLLLVLQAREARPISAEPFFTASMPAPEPVGS